MPDIMIRGIEMPTGELNYREIQVWSDGTVCVRKGLAGSMQQTDAKAVELPPHGDLIDRDEFVKSQCNSCDGSCEYVECDCLNCEKSCRCDVIVDAMEAPVIVPAERREE